MLQSCLYYLTFTSICQVSCLVFLKSLRTVFTLLPTMPRSLAARPASVASTSGSHSGGGEVYGKACTREPSPSTAACRVNTRRFCSCVGVLVPVPAPPFARFGRGFLTRRSVK